MKTAKKSQSHGALRSWKDLNNAMRLADEAVCQRLIEQEKAGKNRSNFILRIHSRINKVRRERERREILKEKKAPKA